MRAKSFYGLHTQIREFVVEDAVPLFLGIMCRVLDGWMVVPTDQSGIGVQLS